MKLNWGLIIIFTFIGALFAYGIFSENPNTEESIKSVFDSCNFTKVNITNPVLLSSSSLFMCWEESCLQRYAEEYKSEVIAPKGSIVYVPNNKSCIPRVWLSNELVSVSMDEFKRNIENSIDLYSLN